MKRAMGWVETAPAEGAAAEGFDDADGFRFGTDVAEGDVTAGAGEFDGAALSNALRASGNPSNFSCQTSLLLYASAECAAIQNPKRFLPTTGGSYRAVW